MEWTTSFEDDASSGAMTRKCLFGSPEMSSPSVPVKKSSYQLTLPEMAAQQNSPFQLFKLKRISRRKDSAAIGSCSTMDSPVSKQTPFAPLAQIQEKGEAMSPFMNNSVKLAVQKSIQEPNLIGDFSRPCSLPTIDGKHPDIMTIAPDTVANIVTERRQNISIIDCRFPYEYDGGHVMGAENIFLKDDSIAKLFHDAYVKENNTILIFYCEFSSKRGPGMYRFVRNKDRDLNKDSYPTLFYPEMYLLEGGYESFFARFQECCVPPQYLKMLDPQYAEELSLYRNQSKRKNISRRLMKAKSCLNF